jgi:peptidoglycan hydrolase-like protein with peptidoglycan-binding domain
MRYLAALAALGLLASTAAYAQNSQGNDQSSSSSQATSQTSGTQALSQPFVRQIQMRLRQQGVYDGKVTGTWDDATAKAVQDFQQQKNIQPTGQIDGATIVALMRPANDMGAGEGSSTPMGAIGGENRMPIVVPLMRTYERGYQQGFEQGLRWAQQQEEQQQQ